MPSFQESSKLLATSPAEGTEMPNFLNAELALSEASTTPLTEAACIFLLLFYYFFTDCRIKDQARCLEPTAGGGVKSSFAD